MNDNQNIEAAIAEAITHVSSRKLGAVVLGMFFLAQVQGPAWMILALGVAYVLGNVAMGIASLLITGKEANGGVANDVLRSGDDVLRPGISGPDATDGVDDSQPTADG